MVKEANINPNERNINKIKFLTIIMNIELPDIKEAKDKKNCGTFKSSYS